MTCLVWEVAFRGPAEAEEIKAGCSFSSTWQRPLVRAFPRAEGGLSAKCHSAKGQLNKHHPEECSESSECGDCGTLMFQSLALTQFNSTCITQNIHQGQRLFVSHLHCVCLLGVIVEYCCIPTQDRWCGQQATPSNISASRAAQSELNDQDFRCRCRIHVGSCN